MPQYLKLLRDHGLRVTAQRSTLLRLLCEIEGHQHITAKDLFNLAGPALPGLNLATVYRTLEGLHEAGLVDRMNTGHDQVHYSFHDPEHRHGHLACKSCGKVEEFDYQTIVLLSQNIRKLHNFQIDREHLTFSGVCRECLEARPAPEGPSARQASEDSGSAHSHEHGHNHDHGHSHSL